MSTLIITTLTSLCTGAVTYGFWLLQERKKMKIRLAEKDKEQEEALIKQRKEMLEEVDKMQSQEITSLIELHMADIKQSLYDMHDKYVEDKGYMPGFLKETLEGRYKYYHSHGGNGHGTHLYNELMNLPEKDPAKKS